MIFWSGVEGKSGLVWPKLSCCKPVSIALYVFGLLGQLGLLLTHLLLQLALRDELSIELPQQGELILQGLICLKSTCYLSASCPLQQPTSFVLKRTCYLSNSHALQELTKQIAHQDMAHYKTKQGAY